MRDESGKGKRVEGAVNLTGITGLTGRKIKRKKEEE
jgi:hypothetical protein